MAIIEVILRDDDGNVIGSSTHQSDAMTLGHPTLDDIEGEVERFKQKALPEIEQTWLNHAQAQFTEEKKNNIGSA